MNVDTPHLACWKNQRDGRFVCARFQVDSSAKSNPLAPPSSPKQQIAIISANNKAWKALEREKNKTIEVTSVIAACIESNRQLKEAKDADKSVRGRLGLTRRRHEWLNTSNSLNQAAGL